MVTLTDAILAVFWDPFIRYNMCNICALYKKKKKFLCSSYSEIVQFPLHRTWMDFKVQ